MRLALILAIAGICLGAANLKEMFHARLNNLPTNFVLTYTVFNEGKAVTKEKVFVSPNTRQIISETHTGTNLEKMGGTTMDFKKHIVKVEMYGICILLPNDLWEKIFFGDQGAYLREIFGHGLTIMSNVVKFTKDEGDTAIWGSNATAILKIENNNTMKAIQLAEKVTVVFDQYFEEVTNPEEVFVETQIDHCVPLTPTLTAMFEFLHNGFLTLTNVLYAQMGKTPLEMIVAQTAQVPDMDIESAQVPDMDIE